MIDRTFGWIDQGKQIALIPLITNLAGVIEIGPMVSEPIVARSAESIGGFLAISLFRPEVLDVAICDMVDFRFTKAAFTMLRLLQRLLD